MTEVIPTEKFQSVELWRQKKRKQLEKLEKIDWLLETILIGWQVCEQL